MHHVTFPDLGLVFDLNPTAFSIGDFSVQWYGVIIGFGFLLAIIYAACSCKKMNIKEDGLFDCVIVGLILGVIGARLYYVIFYPGDYYIKNPSAIFAIKDGGLGIYGGIIGGLLCGALIAKWRKMSVFAVLDVASLGFLIGQCIGRWGNFVNQEAYGSAAENFLRMGIYVNGVMTEVHPTFLYESLWNIAGFVLLHFFYKKRRYSGEVFLLYVAWYGIGRGIIEGLRTDSLYFFGTALRISQFVGFFSAVIAVGVLICLYLFRERDPETLTNPYLPKRVKKKKGEDEEEEEIEAEEEEENVTVISGIDFGTADEDEAAESDAEKAGESEETAEAAEAEDSEK